MSPADLWVLALETLRSRRLRAFLTLLGIVIGIASVVLLSSIGEGTRRGVAAQFSQFGTTVVGVRPGKIETFGLGPGAVGGTTRPFTVEDALALRRIPSVRYVAPHVMGLGEVKTGERVRRVNIYGTVADDQHCLQWYPRVGRFLPEGDPEGIPAVCVLGSTTARELFPGASPLGRRVRIGGSRFTIIGVMSSKGQVLGFDMDDMVYIPLRRAMRLLNLSQVQEAHLYVAGHSMIERAMEDAKRILKERHGGEEDVTVSSQADMLKLVDDVLRVLSAGVLAIAAVSVVVGGLGILTILWVSVHERGSEIGLIKALGASERQVLLVFLAEAASLSGLGGALGLIAGLGGAWILGKALPGLWIDVPLWIVPLALGSSVLVGLVAGVAPARRAARMDPVDALRAE